VDARSDIFSFGVVLYEMLAGKRPFRGATDLEVLKTIAHGAPEPLGEELPIPLRMIVEKALEKDPADRYQSMRDMVVDLKRQTRQATELPASERSNRPLKWLAAVFLALAAGLAVWKVWSTLTPATVASPQIRSIAVLPLENLSGDPKEEYIAEGATDELISNLGQIHAFEKVISRTSVMRYKGGAKSMPEIGRELGVAAIVEGSVQRVSGHTRIRARLILASSEKQLWSREYDREGGDVLGIEAEVAGAIAQEIRAQITPQETVHLARSSKLDPAAQEAFLLGRSYAGRLNEGDLRRATEYFEKAIRIQPDYAAAYAGLSSTWQSRAIFGEGWHATEGFAHQAAMKALELDPSLAVAHAEFGTLLMLDDLDWAGAEKEMRRAAELDPNDLLSQDALAYLFSALGRFPEALEHAERAATLDPLNPATQSDYGRTLYRARRYDQAIPHLKRAIELDPQNPGSISRLADVYDETGKLQEAILLRQQALALYGPENGYASASLARTLALSGHRREAVASLERATHAKTPQATSIALAFFALGEMDRGFQWLRRALDDRAIVVFWKFDPIFDSVHSDPRFQELISRLHIPDSPR
jgi:TolB-like protein/Tfp pilus assembly protein PilF